MNKYWIIRTLIAAYFVGAGHQCAYCGPESSPGIGGDPQCTISFKETANCSVSAFITGFVTVDAAGNPTGFIDLKKDAIIGGWAGGIPLPPGQLVHIGNQAVRIEIQQAYGGKVYRFEALFGGDDKTGRKAAVGVQQSPPSVIFFDGWVFMSGDWPLAEARLVAAISDGTKFILHSKRNATPPITERVYLLSPDSRVDVKKTDGSGESKPMQSKGEYCEVTKGTAGFICKPIDTTGDTFYIRVLAMAQKAGMN